VSQENRIETTESDVRTPVFTQTGGATYPELDKWQQIDEDEVEMVYQMALRNELSGGTPIVRQFEQTWRQRFGSKYAITVNNGTMALYSAMFGVGLGPGDEFICPTYTWICSLSPGLMLGARPVLCESDPESLLLDPADVRRRITDKTRAIVAVHLWGNVCDMDALLRISDETGIPIIEDCSHAHGATYKGRHVGTMGKVGCWSMQGSKTVSAGEGGVVATDDIDVFERACILGQVNRLGGVDLATERYQDLQPFGLGMKTRSHPLGIGIASVQLDKLDGLNERRGTFIKAVEAGLAGVRGIQPVKVYEGAERGGFYGFPMLHVPSESGVSTEAFLAALQAEGLPAKGNPYPLLHTLALFRDGFDIFTRDRGPLAGDYQGYRADDLPVTVEMSRRLIFLPVLSDPVPGAADKVVEAIRRGAASVQS
jgi:dTDP-4-amino-4,6-dideoxygalactose transaminase